MLQEQNTPTLQIHGFLIWVSLSITFTNPFPLTVVSHCFKSLSLHLSHTASPFRSQCTCYFKKKIEVIVWKLFVHPCNPLQYQMATSNNILTFFPPILRDQVPLLLLKAKAVFDFIPSYWCWGFCHSLFFFLSFIFNFSFFASPFPSIHTHSSNFYPKEEINKQKQADLSLLWIPPPLPFNFSPLQLIQSLHSSSLPALSPISKIQSPPQHSVIWFLTPFNRACSL